MLRDYLDQQPPLLAGPRRRYWGEAGRPAPSHLLPAGTALSETGTADISDVTLDDLFRQLLTLRRARIAHEGWATLVWMRKREYL